MYNKITLLVIGLLFLFYGCKEQTNKKTSNNSHISTLESNCQIPLEIEAYLKKNSDKWTKIDLNDFDKELMSFLLNFAKYENSQICPYLISGDFTDDKKDDFGIIVKDEEEKDMNNNYALLIFNNYKNNLTPPYIVKREGAYKEGMIKSVIYSEEEHGILSYLDEQNVCDINVVSVAYFEKSSFFVYWDKNSRTYQFLNHLDTNLCERIKGNKTNESISLIGEWNYNCEYDLTEFSINANNKVFLSLQSDNAIYVNCVIEKDLDKKDTYNLFFNSVASQEYYYKDKKNIVESEISKKESIAKIKILNKKTIEIDWKGLYNLKTKGLDFVDDFVFKKENNNINPITLKKCN